MKIKPLHDWVVIIETEPQEVTAGGIIIPESAKEKPQWGIVDSMGTGIYEEADPKKKGDRKFVPTEVKVGEEVLFEKYMAKEFTVDSQKVVMVRESSILGVLGKEGTGQALQKKGSTELQEKGPSALQKKEHGALAEMKKPAAKKKTNK